MGGDCDDQNPDIHPGAVEIPYDGIDQDCDGTDLVDVDQDTYPGIEAGGEDCDDTNPATYPGATEIPDGQDNDCDGEVDENLSNTDDDGDGFSDAQGDCNDYDDDIWPGAPEIPYDGVDQDCDGADLTDVDQDGYDAVVAGGGDCDDNNAAIHPDADEVCDGVDNNCDGTIDEGVTTTFYLDADGDGFGDPDQSVEACSLPAGFAVAPDDCDDDNAAIHPDADEVCDGVDNNCDGTIDEGVTTTFYLDADGDGFGNGDQSVEACSLPAGFAVAPDDCDDAAPTTYPGADEVWDGADNDCDGTIPRLERDPDEDGVLAFNQALWLMTGTANNTNPTIAGPYGSSEAAGMLESLGVTWASANLSDVRPVASTLDAVGLLIFSGTGNFGALTPEEASDLEQWVRDGGSVLLVGYHDGYNMALINSLPAAFGLSAPGGGAWSGLADVIEPHPVTEEVSDIQGYGGERWTVSGQTTTIASVQGIPFVVTAEIGNGRVLGYTDEWLMYDSVTGGACIAYGDHARLVQNGWEWLHHLR